ncbi:MAG: hypothetical protein CV089_14685 [Nitrospira sp. WS110]|nr:hypothetical protein [Nitrospira sp. WS110]
MNTCSWCLKPIKDETYLALLDVSMNFNKPMIEIHTSCCYEVRAALNDAILKMENKLDMGSN